MIEYDDYKMITDCLTKGNYDDIEKYISKEYNKFRLKVAKDALKSYLSKSSLGYVSGGNGKIIASDDISIYILNDASLFSKHYKERLNLTLYQPRSKRLEHAYDIFKEAEQKRQFKVDELNLFNYDGVHKYYELSTISGYIRYCFAQDNFEMALDILGRESKFKLCKIGSKSKGVPVCMVESDLGKGMVLGLCK